MRPDPNTVSSRWRDRPGGRLYAEVYCAVWTLLPHGNNSYVRKLVTTAVVGTWVTITIGHAAYGWPLPDATLYGPLSAMVGALFAKSHDLELRRLQAGGKSG